MARQVRRPTPHSNLHFLGAPITQAHEGKHLQLGKCHSLCNYMPASVCAAPGWRVSVLCCICADTGVSEGGGSPPNTQAATGIKFTMATSQS